MSFNKFQSLINDMNINNIDKEHYTFTYNHLIFDVIFSITGQGYEILAAVHMYNWGCLLKMDRKLNMQMADADYFSLCNLLNLTWKENHFSSYKFLLLLSEKAPKQSNKAGVKYTELYRYLPYRKVDEADKKYFCGWNNHIKDKRTAHNFDKTEFYFGRKIADYCRINNISSLWSYTIRDEKHFTNPWN